MSDISGIVSNIQRASLHDGPGLRTTIFLKGCNMACKWCHNPETIDFTPEYLAYPDKCIGCDRCTEGCFSGAKVLCGKEMTVKEVIDEALLDKDYYYPDGGITISGGEPLCQFEFTKSILKHAKKAGLHTAIETNLNINFDKISEIFPYCDLIMADLKIFDNAKHKEFTGVGNELILDNLKKLADAGIPLIVRTPLIQNVNDSEEEIKNMALFLQDFDDMLYFELLPYHALGLSKKSENNPQDRYAPPEKEKIAELTGIAQKYLDNIYVANVKIKEN